MASSDKAIKDVTHLDFSQIVIEELKRQYQQGKGNASNSLNEDSSKTTSNHHHQEFIIGDVTSPDLPSQLNQQFDIILDKALLDTLLCSESSAGKINRMVASVYELLKPGGIYIMISYSKDRRHFLEEYQWNEDITIDRVQKPSKAFANLPVDEDENFHYIYVAQKVLDEEG